MAATDDLRDGKGLDTMPDMPAPPALQVSNVECRLPIGSSRRKEAHFRKRKAESGKRKRPSPGLAATLSHPMGEGQAGSSRRLPAVASRAQAGEEAHSNRTRPPGQRSEPRYLGSYVRLSIAERRGSNS